MKTKIAFGVLAIGLGFGASSAQAILISNGIAGDGFWQVDAGNGGESRTGNLNPSGAQGTTDVIFDYFHYVDVGANGGGVRLDSTTISQAATLTNPNEVTSAGSFAGANGTINWRAVSTIAPGSPIYQTALTFSSNTAFGTVRVIQYLDEDVLGVSDDRLVVIGTPGQADFQLLTIDDNNDVGVSHGANYLTATGMTYAGWAARQFSSLRGAITGPGESYSIAGNVTGIPAITDARFPGAQVFGTLDITSAIAFDFDPNATLASVNFTLGGLPSGRPIPTCGEPGLPPCQTSVPEPAGLSLLGIGLLGVGFTSMRRAGSKKVA